MLYHVSAFGVDFYVSEENARYISGYAALFNSEREPTMEEFFWGWAFEEKFLPYED